MVFPPFLVMGKLIDITEYLKCKNIEEDYQKFLTHVNKFIGIPKDVISLSKAFYCTLRYLEGTINCLAFLPLLKPVNEKYYKELKEQIIIWLEGILQDLKNQ